MKLLMLIVPLMILSSCGPDKTRIELPEDFKTEGLTFKTYHKYCGPQNLYNKKNFRKLKDTVVTWKGTVAQVLDDDSSNSYSNKIVRVKMDGTNTVFADVTLRMPNGSEKISVKAVKGDKIDFRGTISYIGSALNDHIVIVSQYKFTRPKVKK